MHEFVPVQLSENNQDYYYEVPHQTHKPIYEENTENNVYRPENYLHINSNEVPRQEASYVNNIENLGTTSHYLEPVQTYYEVDNTNDYNANVKGYSQIYIKTPKFRLLQRQNHDSISG